MRRADELAAGEFSAWLTDIKRALRGEGDAVVPCGGCTACCTSSQFVHIGPDETDTLARIPNQLLFPAPGRPAGHVVLGYDERGHCPMLVEGKCSIYDHRPRTCRTYDCRVFAASDVDPGKPAVAERVQRWRFDVVTPTAVAERDAVNAAARFLDARRDLVRDAGLSTGATQLAVLAVELQDLFLGGADPEPETVQARIRRV